MQGLIIFVCVGVLATMAAELPASEKQFLKQVHDACQANPATYVDEDILRKLDSNVDHKQAGIHMFCMSVKARIQKPDGDFNIPTITEKLLLVVDKSKVDGLVAKCAKKQGSKEKTAVLLWLCFVQNNALYIHKL